MAAMQDDNNRVREWEAGLPSAADLTPLHHTLITRVLARAFCIPASSARVPDACDVLHASQSTLQPLQQMKNASFSLPAIESYSCYEARNGAGAGFVAEDDMDDDRVAGSDLLKRSKDDSSRRNVRVSKSPALGASSKGAGWDGDKASERDAAGSGSGSGTWGVGNSNSGQDYGPAFYWASQGGVGGGGPASYGSLGSDQGGYGVLETGSDSTKGAMLDKSRKLGDAESEDVDSADGTDGNTARTLKRPRLVWTPQLHKRFVDAVGHLGIKNAVPKTIMQLMNVEGLTRENVASHLQKYRLYLKRMQGLSTEGPSASDPIFASAPLPPNLNPNSHFFSAHHHSRPDNGVSGPPFSRPAVPLPRSQVSLPPGPLGSGVMGPGAVQQHYGGFEHHPFSIGHARTAAQRPPSMGEHREFLVSAHSVPPGGAGSPPHRILTLFPTSGH